MAESNQTWYVSHIYIKDFVYVFITRKLHGKASFVRYAPIRVEERRFVLVLSDGELDWLQLWFVTSTY